MTKITPKVRFPINFEPIINALRDGATTNELTLFSGRNSGKTFNICAYSVVLTFEEFYNNIIFLRATKAQISKSVYSQIVNIIKDLGLEDFFVFKNKAMRIENKITKSTIYFDGVDENPYDIKGFTPAMNKLAMVVFEEYTEFSSKFPIDLAIETFIRFKGSDLNNGVIKIVKMGNPSRWNSHWSWDDVELDKVNSKCKVFKPCWTDIKDFLSKPTIEYIENVAITNPRYYKFAYLGERMSYEGLVYPNFDETCLVTNDFMKDKIPVAIICGLDPASKRDKTALTISIFLNTGQLVAVDMWSYNPKEIDNNPLSPSQQTERFMEYLNRFIKRPENYRYKTLPIYIVCDPANGGMDLEIKLNYSKLVTVVNVDKKERLKDIERNTNAFATNKLKILKNVDALKPLIDEISMMVWREKVIGKELKTIKSTQLTIGEDDCHDALTYSARFALMDARFVQYNSELFVNRR